MKTASVGKALFTGFADRVGLLLLGSLVALPLLPEFMVGYLLIGWVLWRIHQGSMREVLTNIPWSFALVIPYFLWYLWRWSATGWGAEGGRIFIMHLQWLLIPLLLLGLPQNLMNGGRKLFYVLWLLVVLTALALLVQGILEYLMRDTPIEGFSDHPLFYIGLSDPLMHPGYLSMIVAVLLIIAPGIAPPAWLQRWYFYLGQLFLIIFFVMLSSRMIMGALLLTWPIAGRFWAGFNRKRRITGAFLMLLLIVVFVSGVLPKPIDNRIRELSRVDYRIDADSLYDFSGVTIRLAEWKGALHAINQQPLLGHGPGLGQNALLDSYDGMGFKVGLLYKFNAHNQYLQTALDLGWIGSVLMILSILALCYPYLSSGNRNVLWFLIFFLLCSITESTLLRQRGAVMLALYVPFLGLFTARSSGDGLPVSGEVLSESK